MEKTSDQRCLLSVLMVKRRTRRHTKDYPILMVYNKFFSKILNSLLNISLATHTKYSLPQLSHTSCSFLYENFVVSKIIMLRFVLALISTQQLLLFHKINLKNMTKIPVNYLAHKVLYKKQNMEIFWTERWKTIYPLLLEVNDPTC